MQRCDAANKRTCEEGRSSEGASEKRSARTWASLRGGFEE